MRRQSQQKLQAFTLVELLLIIVVFGAVMALSLSSYRARTDNIRIERQALKMQQLLAAAIAYHNSAQHNAEWPSGDYGCQNVTEDFVPYIPAAGDKSAFYGECFSFGAVTNNQFQLQAHVPKNVAPAIAARLPNASSDCSGDPCVVTALIAPQNPYYIAGMETQVVDLPKPDSNAKPPYVWNKTITAQSFRCVKGMVGGMETVDSGIEPYVEIGGSDAGENDCIVNPNAKAFKVTGPLSLMIGQITSDQINCTQTDPINNIFSCQANVIGISPRPDPNDGCRPNYYPLGRLHISLLTYCVTQNQAQNKL